LAETYPEASFVQTVAAQIPWAHNCIILDKVKNAAQREWYIQQTFENGWSHNVRLCSFWLRSRCNRSDQDVLGREGIAQRFDLAPPAEIGG